MKKIVIAALCLCASTAVAAPVYTAERIFDPNVRSLKVAPASNPYLPPIITLDGNDVINVNFDYLDYDVQYLRYSVVHCNADWQPSQLVESEYVDGFNYVDINDYEQCGATFTHYVNYNFSVPNEDMPITKSGNYLLRVYRQDDSDAVLFQTRFSICEGTVTVLPRVTTITDIDYNESHQQLSFEVAYRPGIIRDPYGELTAKVTQNSRNNTEVTVTRPMMVMGNKVVYDHHPELIFNAGNEFRRFETVNLYTINMGVSAIEFFEPYYHATLNVDEPRARHSYLYDQTQHGHFTIRTADGDNNTDADYIITHFTLYTGGEIGDGNVIIDGEFTRGLPDEAVRMRYEPETGCYTAEFLLKQGAYNYQYLWVPQRTGKAVTNVIDGDKFQTGNEYLIRIYDHPAGERYDHLAGYAVFFSNRE